MFKIDNLVSIGINIFQIFFQLNIVISFISFKCKFWVTFLCSVVIGCIYYTNPWVMLVVFYCSTFVYYFFIVKMNLIYSSLAITAHLFMSSFISNILYVAFFGLSLLRTDLLNAIMRIIALMIYILMFFIIKHFGINIKKQLNERVMASFIICLLSVSMMSYFINTLIQKTHDLSRMTQIVSSIMLLIIHIVIVYAMVRINRYASEIERYELQQLYTETLEVSLNKLRGFKHDFNNITNALSGFVSLKRYDMLGEYIKKFNQEAVSVKTIDIVNTNLKDTPFLYGIMLSKIAIAELNGIPIQLKITAADYEVNTLNEVELSRMVGNLLDNALEASLESEGKFIHVEICNYLTKLKIIIRNSFIGEIDLEKITQSGFTTKQKHSGYGLFEARQIVNKYRKKGMYLSLDISVQDGLFVVELLV